MSAAPRLLLAPGDVLRRALAARGPLGPLADSLASDLARAAEHDLEPPAEKARLTRAGGRCPADGAMLAFDPFSPRRHRCPVCGCDYDDEAHYRWWIMWRQLWLAERAVHGAALALVAGRADAGEVARRILERFADLYLAYPNSDNVLGPSRPFFSTYLESIWLLQLCIAVDLLEAAGGAGALGDRVRERVVVPSRALVASYDEGGSNRQVWNAAALLAAARVLGDRAGAEQAVHGPSGVASHLGGGLLSDGTWFEGENYHGFAHRGLWYGVVLAERAGLAIEAPLLARFAEGFVAPFLTALPDLTLPARRDSQYAISLRQWRFAESCELGLARVPDPRLEGALVAIYDPNAAARQDTGRWRSAAESERNEPASRLDRADLGWRSLLFARPDAPVTPEWTPASVLLPEQGIAVFRRDRGRVWAALDYGHSGGGHGHPDRLNLLLADGATRWLDDMGTGSYVERALHWYRSTLAHNAPLVDGRSQARVDGELLAYDERADWGWVLARAAIAPGVIASRSLVVGDGYAIDRLTWDAERDVTLDLPLHVDAERPALAWRAGTASGAGGREDGFDFLHDLVAAPVGGGDVVRLVASPAAAWVSSPSATTWHHATAPAAPGRGSRAFYFIRARGARGEIVSVWSLRGDVLDARIASGGASVRLHDGREHGHRWSDIEPGWRIDDATPGRDALELGQGSATPRPARRSPAVALASSGPALRIARGQAPIAFVLGAGHYRASELTWEEAGRPSVTVTLAASADALHARVAVAHSHRLFVPLGSENPLDNERAELNGDGIQLYVRGDGDTAAWLLVLRSDAPPAVELIALTPPAVTVPLEASWERVGDGYAVELRLPLAAHADELAFDLIVNETSPGRERRRGQLVLSGARGERVYLQGDRHDPARFLRLHVAP